MTSPAVEERGAASAEALARAGLAPARRLLDPDERFSEILFGLIMVISITGTVSVAAGGTEEVVTMLRAAIGCNLAWGITDAVMWILSTLIVRGRGLIALRAVRESTDPRDGRAIIAAALPPAVGQVLTASELEGIRRRLVAAPPLPERVPLRRDDLLAAVAICALVFLSTFPVVIPFLVMDDATRALRLSHAIAIALLFLLGWRTAKPAGARPWRLALGMVVLGAALVGMVVALGG